MCLDAINTSRFSKIEYLYSNHKTIVYSDLKNMFESGLIQHGLSNEHDEFLDITATLLINKHNDKTILPTIVDMIFYRNREGLFTHDLIWTFFQAKDPYSLMLIANFLNSKDVCDVKLSCKLLDFVPSIDMILGECGKKQYMDFYYWLKENYPFLYFTGESFQRTSKPIRYIVALDAKYLCRRVSLDTGKSAIPLTEKENRLLFHFNGLDDDNKLLLSNFSFKSHYENIYLWRSWINSSFDKQISIAKSILGA